MSDGRAQRLAWILAPSVVAVAVAVVLLVLDMSRRADEPPTVAAEREGLDTGPALEPFARHAEDEPERPAHQKSQEEPDQEKVAKVRLSGTVVDTFGAPVAGADIQPVRTSEYAVDRPAAVTDEDGSFDVTVPSRLGCSVPSSTTRLRSTDPLTGLVVKHKDYVPQYVPLRGPDDEFTATEGLEIVLERGGTIEGIVRDEAGNPLPEFEVGPMAEYAVAYGWTGEAEPSGPDLLRWSSATTDRYGHYVLAGFTEGVYRTESRVEGYEGRSGLVRLGPQEVASDVNVTVHIVRHDGVIGGTILDENHAPVVGLKVRIRGNRADLWVTTNAEGQYRAEGLLVEAEYSVAPWLRRLRDDWGKTMEFGGPPKDRDYVAMPYRRCSQTVRPNAEDLDFVLEPFHPAEPGSFTVYVSRHSDGAPVREFALSYAGKEVKCESDDGSYSQSNVPPGTYTITIDAAGFPRFETEPFEIRAGQEVTQRIALPAGARVYGRVYRAADQGPVEAFTLFLVGEDGWAVPGYYWKAFRSETGSYLCTNIAPGQYRLVIRAGAMEATAGPFAVAEGEEIIQNVVLRVAEATRGGTVRGAVYGVSDGQPVRTFRLALLNAYTGVAPPPYKNRTYSSNDGSFVCTDVEPGEYRIQITADGFPTFRTEDFAVAAGQVVARSIVLAPAGTVQGTVLDEEGRPVPNATVTAWTGKTSYVYEETGKAVTDDAGQFVLADQPPGKLSFLVRHADHHELEVRDIVVTGGGTEHVVLRYQPGATIRGRVLGPDGEPLSDYGVGLQVQDDRMYRPGGTKRSYHTITDYRGEYIFTEVPSGTYHLDPELKPPFRVEAGETLELDFDFSRAGSLSGTIRADPSLENVRFETAFLRAYSMELKTDTHGAAREVPCSPENSFDFGQLLPGKYYVRAYGRASRTVGGQTANFQLVTEATVDVSPGEEAIRDLKVTEISETYTH